MAVNRRLGKQNSPTYAALLDAVERVMREEGYAAATSRRIAEAAGVKQQLVYYYFKTMDDLLLATFKRRTSQALNRVQQEIATEQPIQAIWNNLTTRLDATLVFEFVALANRHEGIRAEIARFMTASRRMEAAAIARQFEDRGIDLGPVTPAAATFVMFCCSLMLGREAATGIEEGHDEVWAMVDWALNRLG